MNPNQLMQAIGQLKQRYGAGADPNAIIQQMMFRLLRTCKKQISKPLMQILMFILLDMVRSVVILQ